MMLLNDEVDGYVNVSVEKKKLLDDIIYENEPTHVDVYNKNQDYWLIISIKHTEWQTIDYSLFIMEYIEDAIEGIGSIKTIQIMYLNELSVYEIRLRNLEQTCMNLI